VASDGNSREPISLLVFSASRREGSLNSRLLARHTTPTLMPAPAFPRARPVQHPFRIIK